MAQQIFNRIAAPQKGLYTTAVSDAIGPEYTPWCQNVRFRHAEVIRAPGRSQVLQTRTRTIMDFGSWTSLTGVRHTLSFEASTQSDNHVALYDPVAKTLGAGNLMAASQLSRRFSWTQGEERLFVCRASPVTAVQVSGTATTVQTLGAPACQLLEYFNNRLFAMNHIAMSNRIQWSTRANYADWVVASGRSGWLDLYEGQVEQITGGKVLNDRLVVYRTSSITDFVATGDDTTPFLPQGRAYGIGCMAPWTLQSAGQFHIFLANDFNVYLWDGAKLEAIGTPIHTYIRRLVDQADLSVWQNMPFAAMFTGFKEYHLVIPKLQGSECIVLIYDYQRGTWSRDVYQNLRSLYEVHQTAPPVVGTPDPGFPAAPFPVVFPTLLAGRNMELFMIDERVNGDRLNRPTDGGMEMFFDSPDMYWQVKEGPPDQVHNATLERIIVQQGWPSETSATPYKVEVSVDRGLSFPISVVVTPTQSHWGFEFVDVNVTGHVRRYRFRYPVENGSGQPSWRGYTELYVPSGEFFPSEREVGGLARDLPATGVE